MCLCAQAFAAWATQKGRVLWQPLAKIVVRHHDATGWSQDVAIAGNFVATTSSSAPRHRVKSIRGGKRVAAGQAPATLSSPDEIENPR